MEAREAGEFLTGLVRPERPRVVAGLAVGAVLGLSAVWFPEGWQSAHAELQGGTAARLAGRTGVDLFRLGLLGLACFAVLLGFFWPAIHASSSSSSGRVADPGAMSRRSALYWLLGLTAVGALIRSWGLGGSLWLDELYTQGMASRNTWIETLANFRTTNNHIVHTLLTKVWIGIFGNHEWVVRITAYVFGVAGIYATYGLARRIASREAAVWASALCAVAYHHVMFSQNARGYTAQLFFFTLACGYLHDAVRMGRTRDWIRFVLSSWVSLWFVFLVGFTFVAHGLVAFAWILVRSIRGRSSPAHLVRCVFAFAGLALLSFQFYALMVPSIVQVLAEDYGADTGVGLHILGVNFLRDFAAGFGLTLPQAFLVGSLAAAVGCVVGVGVVRRYSLMLMLMVSPSLVIVAFALQSGLDVYPRFFLSLMIGFFVVLAEVGSRFGKAWARPWLVGRHPLWDGWPLIAVLLLFLAVLPRVVGVPKQPFSGALDWTWDQVRDEPSSGPQIYCLGYTWAGCTYYAPRLGVPDETIIFGPSSEEVTRARLDRAPEIFALTTLRRLMAREKPELFEELRTEWKPVRRFKGSIGDGDVVVWRPKDGSPADREQTE